MNYNNKDNQYGMKPVIEKGILSVEDEIAQSCTSNCDGDCYKEVDCYYENQTSCQCDKQQDFDNGLVLTCPDSCEPVNNCCSVNQCTYDSSKATCFCTYMDILYSEGQANGPTIFNAVTISSDSFSIIPTYTQSSGCCTSCGIDSTSIFTVDSIKTTLKDFTLNQTTIPTSQIMVNGYGVLGINKTAYGYSALIDPSSLDSLCVCNDLGTKGNIFMMGLQPWQYNVKYELCGTVVTQGNSCHFRMVAQNLPGIPSITEESINLVATDICLPASSNAPIGMDIVYGGEGNLINPSINVIGGPAPLPTTISISGNLMLNINADIRILQNTKVCMKGVVNPQ